MYKVHKEDFTTVLALIAITVTSSISKHYKEPMFLHLSLSIFIIYQFFTHSLLQKFKNSSIYSSYVGEFLKEGPLVGMSHGKFLFGFFCYTMEGW